jgi:hypothetical protein
MKVACSSETSVEFYRTTRRDIPEDRNLHNNEPSNSMQGDGLVCSLIHIVSSRRNLLISSLILFYLYHTTLNIHYVDQMEAFKNKICTIVKKDLFV